MVQGFIIFKKSPRKNRNEYFKKKIFKFIPIKFFERDGIMAFTLVEILITLAIIGVLATIAIPQFAKSRSSTQKSLCINNLRQIDAAIDRWVFENNFSEGGALSGAQEEEAYSYLRYGKPNCPSSGVYKIGVIGTFPQITCTIEGHTLGDSSGYLGR